jgi:hypothetical protein
MVAYSENTCDGHRCNHCDVMLKPINNGRQEELINRYIADIEFPTKRKKNITSNMLISLAMKDIERISIGLRLVDAFEWRGDRINFDSILQYDKDTKNIVIKESDLMRLIQVVNPYQKERNIRMVK